MKISTLFKALSIFAVVTSGKTEAQFMNPLTICNNFALGTDANITLPTADSAENGACSTGLSIQPQTCANVSAANTTFFPQSKYAQGNSEAITFACFPTEVLEIGNIQVSEFGDMIYESVDATQNTCAVRTNKNTVVVSPPINYVCPFPNNNQNEEEKTENKPALRH